MGTCSCAQDEEKQSKIETWLKLTEGFSGRSFSGSRLWLLPLAQVIYFDLDCSSCLFNSVPQLLSLHSLDALRVADALNDHGSNGTDFYAVLSISSKTDQLPTHWRLRKSTSFACRELREEIHLYAQTCLNTP
jgi:hypothetical protein